MRHLRMSEKANLNKKGSKGRQNASAPGCRNYSEFKVKIRMIKKLFKSIFLN